MWVTRRARLKRKGERDWKVTRLSDERMCAGREFNNSKKVIVNI